MAGVQHVCWTGIVGGGSKVRRVTSRRGIHEGQGRRRLGHLVAGRRLPLFAAASPGKSEVSVELRTAGQECEAVLEGCSVYLVGMMGTGKTVTASLLASALPGYSALDTDDLISRSTGKTAQEIIEAEGEAEFRKVEGAVLSQVAAFRNVVLATGGGVAVTRENWMHLHNGVVVWLDVAADEIVGRLEANPAREVGSRPLLKGGGALQETVARILDERRQAYAQADLRVDAGGGKSAEDVALAVLQEIAELVNSSENQAYRRRLSNPQAFSMNATEINTPIVPEDDVEA